MKLTRIRQAAAETTRKMLRESLRQEELLQQNEIEANKLVAFVMFCSSLLLVLVWTLCRAGIFALDIPDITPMTVRVFLELMLPALICRAVGGRPRWMKYLLVVELLIVLSRVDCALSYNVVLLMAIPVVVSCRYFSGRFTAVIALLTALLFGLSSYASARWDMGLLDLNFYDLPEGTVVRVEDDITKAVRMAGVDAAVRTREVMLLSFLPRLLVFCIIAAVCIKLASKGRELVERQEQSTRKTARITSELELARDIQGHMLPDTFPPFPGQNEIDLYATMHPAKEVGGDFYDFFLLDEKHLCMVVADVSGKGVPAALVMVITKTLIKNEMSIGQTPAEAFTKVNHMLNEGNDNNMFVTAWLGVLDTESGILTYVNAGHDPPLVRQNGGTFEFLRSRPGFVLAGMDGICYRQNEFQMQPGDRLFLYTDGITEAVDPAKELYGSGRLQAYLNAHANVPLAELLSGLTADIAAFAGAEEQADDMTMLVMDYIARHQPESPSD